MTYYATIIRLCEPTCLRAVALARCSKQGRPFLIQRLKQAQLAFLHTPSASFGSHHKALLMLLFVVQISHTYRLPDHTPRSSAPSCHPNGLPAGSLLVPTYNFPCPYRRVSSADTSCRDSLLLGTSASAQSVPPFASLSHPTAAQNGLDILFDSYGRCC